MKQVHMMTRPARALYKDACKEPDPDAILRPQAEVKEEFSKPCRANVRGCGALAPPPLCCGDAAWRSAAPRGSRRWSGAGPSWTGECAAALPLVNLTNRVDGMLIMHTESQMSC